MDFYGIWWTGYMLTIPLIIGSCTAHNTVLTSSFRKINLGYVGGRLYRTYLNGINVHLAFIIWVFHFSVQYETKLITQWLHYNFLAIFRAIGLCGVSISAVPPFTQANRGSITTLYFDLFGKKTTQYSPLQCNRDWAPHSFDGEEADHNKNQVYRVYWILRRPPSRLWTNTRPSLLKVQRNRLNLNGGCLCGQTSLSPLVFSRLRFP